MKQPHTQEVVASGSHVGPVMEALSGFAVAISGVEVASYVIYDGEQKGQTFTHALETFTSAHPGWMAAAAGALVAGGVLMFDAIRRS